jgi:hypothetical protein
VNPAQAPGEAYLLATLRDPLGPVDRWPVGVVEGRVDPQTLQRFADVVDAPLRSMDPQLRSHLVYAGPAPADGVRAAATAIGVAPVTVTSDRDGRSCRDRAPEAARSVSAACEFAPIQPA